MVKVNVTVESPSGTQKENVKAIMVGDARWGENGAAYNTSKQVESGTRTVTVTKTTHPKEIKKDHLIPEHDSTLKIEVKDTEIVITQV
ncbi:hypothetical protein [Pseudomonas sp. EpS/L25]|uniref:hypothetical protein n=1 Tax=Pseudomonas sp. EpS/L25 TaxID=1749078 RepID=UPI000B294886|nr:hypothetical protein [Pseudomonas sp. EpS/L25]